MKFLGRALIALAATAGFASAANATISVSAVPGGSPYTGPTPTYDFDTVATTPVTNPPGNTPPGPGGIITIGTFGNLFAQPVGSTGHYYAVGPSTQSPGTVLFNLPGIAQVSFIWGSIDTYNSLTFTDAAGNPLGAAYTFTGSYIASLIPALASGNRSAANTNPIVTFLFGGTDIGLIGGMQLTSTQNAFEIDNISIVSGVPEPGTWAMMLLGFGAVGLAVRRRRSSKALTQLA
jgi:hypothetical protein